MRGNLRNLARSFQTVHAGHQEIKDEYVGGKFFCQAHRLFAVFGFSAHFPILVTAQESAHALPHYQVVVGDQYAGCHFVPAFPTIHPAPFLPSLGSGRQPPLDKDCPRREPCEAIRSSLYQEAE